ncbi:MAG: S-layer homology domain-containing protein [Clostridia bacterium]|nr:S-layer homology domain-containing protein [Clostridia bacterium]
MKRTLLISLAAVMIAAFLLPASVPAAAEENVIVKVATVTAKRGETVEIPVTLENNTGVSACTMIPVYDPDELTVVSVKHDASVPGQSSYADKFVWFAGADHTADGPFAAVTVTVSESAPEGALLSLSFEIEPDDFSNYDEKNVPVSVVAGGVVTEGLSEIDASEVFADVKRDDWFCDSVGYAYSHGLMKGVSSSLFAPGEPMSRAMLVTVLWRAEGSPAAAGGSPFGDLREDWYGEAVAWAFSNEVIRGVSDTSFDPDAPLTREQIAAILFRYSASVGRDVSARANLDPFPDHGVISAYAVDALSWANAEGLVNGTKEGAAILLDPLGDASRAQVAAILTRYMTPPR